MLNSLKGSLCTKAYQRRATAYRALQQYGRAVADLEAAVSNDPDSKELTVALAAARREQEEQRKQKQLRKVMHRQPAPESVETGGEAGEVVKGKAGQKALPEAAADEPGMDLEQLRRVEQLVQELQRSCSGDSAAAAAAAVVEAGAGEGQGVALQGGPRLPVRSSAGKGGGKASADVVAEAATTDPVARACSELAALLQDNDMACVYLREIGGLQAAAKVVPCTKAMK